MPRVVPGGSGERAGCACSLVDPAHWWGDRPLSLGLRDMAALLVRAGSEKVPAETGRGLRGCVQGSGEAESWPAPEPQGPRGSRGPEVWGRRGVDGSAAADRGTSQAMLERVGGPGPGPRKLRKGGSTPLCKALPGAERPAPTSAGFWAWALVHVLVSVSAHTCLCVPACLCVRARVSVSMCVPMCVSSGMSLCVFACVSVHVCVHVSACLSVCLRVCLHMSVCPCACVHVFTHMRLCVCPCACVRVSARLSLCVCVCLHISVSVFVCPCVLCACSCVHVCVSVRLRPCASYQ